MFRSYHSTPSKWIFLYSNYIGYRNWEMTSRQSRQRFVVNNLKLNKQYTPHPLCISLASYLGLPMKFFKLCWEGLGTSSRLRITTILCVIKYFYIRMSYLYNIAIILSLKLHCKACHTRVVQAMFPPPCHSTPKFGGGVLASRLFLAGTMANENMWRIPLVVISNIY